MVRIYEVIEKATSAAWYKCRELVLVAANWDAVDGDKFAYTASTELISVLCTEEYGGSTTHRSLAKGDRMFVWDYTDCRGTTFKVGVRLTPDARIFKTTEGVTYSDSNEIECNIIANDGTTEITTPDLGSVINVVCPLSMNSYLLDISDASPRLESVAEGGDFFFASFTGRRWRCLTTFWINKDCLNE